MTVLSPVAPSLGGAIRAAAIDFYSNSWRLVPANLVWAAVLLAVLVVGGASIVGLALAPLLAIPTGGLFAVAARLARGGSLVAAMRPRPRCRPRHGPPAPPATRLSHTCAR